MLQMFSYKMGNFNKIKISKKYYSLLVKRGKIPLKRGPQRNGFFGGPPFSVPYTRGLEKNIIFIHPSKLTKLVNSPFKVGNKRIRKEALLGF